MSTSPPVPEREQRLDSWKEIADYLGKDVRTAIRWEKERGLPVRRLPGGKRQPVFAFVAEIDAWVARREAPLENSAPQQGSPVDQGRNGFAVAVPARRSAPIPFRALTGLAALAALVFLVWFLNTRNRQPHGIRAANALPREVQWNAGARPIKFLRSPIETGIQPYTLEAADLNGDGNMDLVFSTSPEGMLGVLLGKGDGSFFPVRLIEGCPHSYGPVVADFNRDGHLDIAAACFGGNFVLVLWGRGDGTFSGRTEIPVPGGPRFLAAGDLNGDGWPDLAVSCYGESGLYALVNRSGHFSSNLLSRFEQVGAVSIADLSGEGRRELIAGVRSHGRFGLAVFPWRTDGSPGSMRFLPSDVGLQGLPIQFHVHDLDGDGHPDLAMSMEYGEFVVRRGLGRGEFANVQFLLEAESERIAAQSMLADLNLDGHPDLLVSDHQSLRFFQGGRGGEFISRGAVQVGLRPASPVVADFNNDHLPDIVINSYPEGPSLLIAAWQKEGGA